MDEAGAAGGTEILNHDVADGGATPASILQIQMIPLYFIKAPVNLIVE